MNRIATLDRLELELELYLLERGILVLDSDFKEEEHPRDEDGKFAKTNTHGVLPSRMTTKNTTGKHPIPGEKISEKKLSEFTGKMDSIGIETRGFEEYRGNPEFLDTIYEEMGKIKELYPEEMEGVPLCYTTMFEEDGTMSEDSFGMYNPKDGSIHLNKVVFDGYDFAVESHKTAVRDNMFPKGTSLKATMWHEAGHRFGYFHDVNYKARIDNLYARCKGKHISISYMKVILHQELSECSTTYFNNNYRESLAEAFAEYYNSSNPRWFCVEIMKEMGAIE